MRMDLASLFRRVPLIAAFLVLALIYPLAATAGSSDLNGDGAVDSLDLGVLMHGWGTLDLNGDGLMNAGDLETLLAARAAGSTPVILYTDIVAGPNSGGENDNGAYLRLFGYNFGAAASLGTATKVYINGVEVADYKGLRDAKSQPFMGQVTLQELAVQVGALGNPTPGLALPIKIVRSGKASNTDHSFTVQPGDMIYVALTGSDTTGDGSYANPYRYVQNPSRDNPAWAAFGPGDTIVMRGGTWNDTGWDNRFARFDQYHNGTAPNGVAGNGYYTITAYPGEEAVVSLTYAAGNHKGAFSGASSSYHAYNHYVTLANLTINDDDPTKPNRSGGGPVNCQTSGDHWRIVNNELTVRIGEVEQRAGGITGGYRDAALLGNYIHDIQGQTSGSGQLLNHGVYLDNYVNDVEIAYNHLEVISGGSGMQFYGNLGSSCGYPSCPIYRLAVHHNLVDTVSGKYGLNITTMVVDGQASNNMVMHTRLCGLRLGSTSFDNFSVANNSFYDVAYGGNPNDGAVYWDGQAPAAGAVYMENNIVYAAPTAVRYYLNYNESGADAGLEMRNNLWFGLGTSAPSKDTAPVAGDPLFVSTTGGAEDLRVEPGSPAIDAGTAPASPVTNDFFFNQRLDTIDVGAHEGG